MSPTTLKRLRARLGLTQVEFAEKIGITPNSLARMERGELGMRRTTELAIKLLVESIERESKKKGRR